jgi:hypothetical protein
MAQFVGLSSISLGRSAGRSGVARFQRSDGGSQVSPECTTPFKAARLRKKPQFAGTGRNGTGETAENRQSRQLTAVHHPVYARKPGVFQFAEERYLLQIPRDLGKYGILQATRGAELGFVLARA